MRLKSFIYSLGITALLSWTNSLLFAHQTINIQIDGKSFEVNKHSASRGPEAIDLSSVTKELGLKIYDPGLTYTASTNSSVSFIDGPAGRLLYRGYAIQDLVSKDYVNVAYLLIYGQLPSEQELQHFNQQINRYSKLKPSLKKLISELGKTSDPMSLLPRFIMSLTDDYPQLNKDKLSEAEKVDLACLILGQTRSFIAKLYQKKASSRNLEFSSELTINQESSYAEAFVQEAYQESGIEDKLSLASKAINILLVLHADHGQNCSTSTLRSVTSAKASPFFALNAAVSALAGAAHGKANHDVVKLLKEIEAKLIEKQKNFGGQAEDYLASEIAETLNKVKNKEMLLPGFGHRVYTSFDPRAKVLKSLSREVLSSLNKEKSLLTIANALEKAALADPFFKKRNLYPNLDFYSGIIYTALEIPEDMLTVMFAFGRMSGWLAHYHEMTSEPFKIWRPGQVYIGQ